MRLLVFSPPVVKSVCPHGGLSAGLTKADPARLVRSIILRNVERCTEHRRPLVWSICGRSEGIGTSLHSVRCWS